MAEGATPEADGLAQYFQEHKARLGFELRVTTLGHVQRGGMPVASDRLLATRLGARATQELAAGNHGVLVGLRKGEIVTTPHEEVVSNTKTLDTSLFELARVLAK